MQTLFIMLFLLSSVFLVISAVALIVVYLKKSPTSGKWKKRFFASLAATLVTLIIGVSLSDGTQNPAPATKTEQTEQSAPAQPEQETPSTPEGIIRQAAMDASNGTKFRNVEVDTYEGKDSVIVMLDTTEDNFSERSALNTWKRTALAEQKAIYQSAEGKNIKKVIVQVYADFKGKDGQTSNAVAFWAAIDGDKAASINWDDPKLDIDKIAETYVHPSIKKAMK
ncbi:MAG: hypothetical protein SOV43_01935 [Selenomonadaceae bacterium]|nr:hypothetical protein [Selenomonadaceae bacterium]